MISFLAKSLVLTGCLILVGSLVPVRQLLGELPRGPVRNRWLIMFLMIVAFALGYLGYLRGFWERHEQLMDLIVPSVFFCGACFVWLNTHLALQTTRAVMRISVLEQENVTDPLTGVFNRRHMDRRLNEEVARARRYGAQLSVLLLDIDHFKQVNDHHGHQAGDQVLIAIGELIRPVLRSPDILARYGGEEFLVITPETPVQGAIILAERIRKCVESHHFSFATESGDSLSVPITCSIGVAGYGSALDSAEKIIQAADAHLYHAKQGGRNQVRPENGLMEPLAA